MTIDTEPRSAASLELAELVDARIELERKLRAIDDEQRTASEAVARFSGELSELERRAAGGVDVADNERKKHEVQLAKARAMADEPWDERRVGVRAAIRDRDRELQMYVGEHFTELIGDLHDEGERAANAVTEATTVLAEAIRQREAVHERVSALASMVRPVRPGDVAGSRAERLAAEANKLLENGGEQPPTLLVDPRGPRHGGVLAEELSA